MRKLFLLLLLSASCTLAAAQDMEPIPERQQVIKISDFSTFTNALINVIANKDRRTRYYGLGIHYEKLITNRLSFEARGVYYHRVSLITLQSGSQPAVTVRGEEVDGLTLSTGIRSYFRKNRFNHHNGFFTGGYLAYSYQNINTINHLNVIHIGIPVGYQHKFSNNFTLEIEASRGHGLWTNLEGRPPTGPTRVYDAPKGFIAAHIAIGYVF